jgi:hypothetical protein
LCVGKFFGKDLIVPPVIGTAEKLRDSWSVIDLSNNETYTEYIDMLISEALVRINPFCFFFDMPLISLQNEMK